MLPFADQPYTYTPPSYFAPTAWFLRTMNRLHRLPNTFRIKRFDLLGTEHAGVFQEPKTRVVIVANHSTHIDAPLLIEALRRVRVVPRTMAAYDVYLRGTIDAWVLRRLGCFSVDREASDKQALDEAARTIEEGKFPLALFPEGNVYLENDAVTEFQDGAALLAIRAAKSLAERGVRVVVLPVSIKLSHLTDCRGKLKQQIELLAKKTESIVAPQMTPADALTQIAWDALESFMMQLLQSPTRGQSWSETINRSAGQVLDGLELRMGAKSTPEDSLMDRVKRCRRQIHAVLVDESRSSEHEIARQWADQAMLAFRIASYSPRYVADHPTLDRIGEWVEKLYEDLHDAILPAYADRAAYVRFNAPIDVSERLASGAKQKQLIGQITAEMHAAVQGGVDAINARNQLPGASIWNGPIG
jgi:1-acyl-sn-glycerol-3-phosphate acyltransferase